MSVGKKPAGVRIAVGAAFCVVAVAAMALSRPGHRGDAPTEPSVVDGDGQHVSPLLHVSGSPPPPSPGIPIARTSYDYQHNHSSGYQVGRLPGADIVHLCWMHWGRTPTQFDDRFVHYNSYTVSTATLNQGFDGVSIGLGVYSRAGYTNLAVGSDNAAHLALHQRPDAGFPYAAWRIWMYLPGSALHIDDSLSTNPVFGELLWPRVGVSRNVGTTDIVHVLAHGANEDPQDRIIYWRFGEQLWEGPAAIDSNPTLGYVPAADANSDKVAIVMHTTREPAIRGINNIAYYESVTEGAGWISGVELGDAQKHLITNYTDSLGPEAYLHISTCYDNDNRLHIVWDELRQRGLDDQVAIRHWNDERGTIRTVARAYYGKPFGPSVFNQNLAKVTMGIGDGSTPCQGGSTTNRNYLYVLYTKFGGETPAEQADYSALNEYNGELYLNVSADAGFTWSRPTNLTNTKTPHCNPGPGTPINPDPPRPDSVCRSEHWATIGQDVHDIDIIFISDLDAGGIVQGEGTWQMNPVHYLRLPGGTTDAPYLCPQFGTGFAAALSAPGACGYHVDPDGQDSTILVLSNIGTVPLDGAVTVEYTDPSPPPTNWLSVNGSSSYPFVIPADWWEDTVSVRMDGSGLTPGIYQAILSVTHTDTSRPSPLTFPIVFSIAPCACHGDPVCDGQTDVLDVVAVVGEAFRGTAPSADPSCPHVSRNDLDCDCVVDVRDVVGMVDRAFRGDTTAPCSPCSQPCS